MNKKAIRAALVGALGLLLAAVPARAQEKPTPITGKLPAKAECVVCSAAGEGHGAEKAVAGVMYRGKAYYFCNKKEVAAFTEDPQAFLPPALPRPAPALTLKSAGEGPTMTLAGMKGKVALVDFWATWCAPCVKAMPDLQKLHDKYENKGFTVLGVSIDEDGMKSVGPFLAKKRLTYPILLDTGGAWQRWGVRAVPAMFLIDRNGRIVRQWTGKIDKKEVERAVAEQMG